MNGRYDNLGIAVQGIRKVNGSALIVHNLDKSGLVLHRQNRFLKLSVNNDTVGNNADRIEDGVILAIVQGRQPMSEPSNRVGLATTCRMLNQIVLVGMVFHHVRNELTNRIELMITGEYQGFLGFALARIGVLLCGFLQENDFVNQIQYRIFLQNIFPHIRYVNTIIVVRVALTRVDSRATPLVEGEEERGRPLKVRTHINLVQVHRKVGKASCFELQ